MTTKPRIVQIECHDGLRYVNGRPHGFKWKNQWEVIFTFESEEEAEQFMDAGEKLLENQQNEKM